MSRFSMLHRIALLAAVALPVLVAPVAGALAQSSASDTASALPKAQSEKVEQYIKNLHQELAITTAEEPQWGQFAQVIRDNAAQMEQALATRRTSVDGMSAADDMQSYAQLAQVHAANMQKLAGAFQTLYATFPDDQKKVADAVFKDRDAKKKKHHAMKP
jgi:protein CpxP